MFENLIDAFEQMIERKLSDINTNMPGTVVSYDAAKNRATVRPVMPKRLAEDDSLDPPQIVEVPVVWPTSNSGKASFTMPLQPGDKVMIAVQQRSLENWLGGNNDMPDDPRQFDLSDSVAIPGCSAKDTTAHDKNVVLKFDKTNITITPENTIIIGNDKGSITIDQDGNMTMNAKSVKIVSPSVDINPS